jgi:hypothetical protein
LLSEDQNKSLINAVDRNTAATRAVAIYLLGSIPWVLAGSLAILFGTITGDAGIIFMLLGAGLILFGVITTMIRAFKELAFSDFKPL